MSSVACDHTDWTLYRLGGLVTIDKGRVVQTVPSNSASSIPYIGADSFGGSYSQFTQAPSAVLCEPTDVLMLWDGERSGLCATGLSGAIGSTVARLRSRGGVESRFLYHQLSRQFSWIQARRTGTGVPHVPKDLASTLVLLIPKDRDEQSRIAAVLDMVDETIAKTEAVIAKLKQVRAGLLHDLLTRGIDERGQLRDPVAHPEHFKDYPLGGIPKDWRYVGVLDVAPADRQAILTGPFGEQLGQRDFVDDGVPVLRIGNVQSGYIDLSDVQHVSRTKAIELQRFQIVAGDLLFARQGATTGRNALADEKCTGALINYHIIRVAVDCQFCEPVYLHAIFNSKGALQQINRDKGRGTREGINTEQIASLRFGLPGIEEQQRAVAILTNHDAAQSAEVALLSKLYNLKTGLMADLLTGRVRVPENLFPGETPA